MSLNQAINSLDPLIDRMANQSRTVEFAGLSGSDQALLISRIYHQLHFPILVVAPSVKQAQRFVEDLRFFDHPAPHCFYFRLIIFYRINFFPITAKPQPSEFARFIKQLSPGRLRSWLHR
jgi:hypothetical protein